MPKVKPPTEIQQQKINELKSLAQSFRSEIRSGRGAWPVRRTFTESGFKELKVVQDGSVNVGMVAVTNRTPLQESNVGEFLQINYRGIEIKNLKLSDAVELLPLILKLGST